MKSKMLTVIAMACMAQFAAGQMINNFDAAPADTNYWSWFDSTRAHFGVSDNAHADSGWINISYPTTGQAEGAGAMQLEWSAHNIEGWGGYTKLEHWNPDSDAVYNWAGRDSISFQYNNTVPQDLTGRVHLRLNLHEVSDSPDGNKTYDVNDVEYYYGFQYILDTAPGWNTIKMPLLGNVSWDGNGFNLTGWSGIGGNNKFDKNKIKGFSLEFSINGAGEGDRALGTILIDDFKLFSPSEYSLIFFNGKAIPNDMDVFTWGAAFGVEEGTGADGASNSLKLTPAAGAWSGAGYNIPPSWMNYLWPIDTLRFQAKAEAGFGSVRIQWEAGPGKVGLDWTPTDDGAWHDYEMPLRTFNTYYDDTSGFDTSAVAVMQFVFSDANTGKTVWFDNFWTGNPEIDVTPPAAPTGLSAETYTNYNLVLWTDTPDEANEVYDIYASPEPITDLTDPMVDVVARAVSEDVQNAIHRLSYPLVDTNVDFYYAVVCTDGAGNTSDLVATTAATNNLAKGIATVSLSPPANFAADGDVTEWQSAGIMPFVLKQSTTHIAVGAFDDDADLTGSVYLAADADYFYFAADVVDNVYSYDAAGAWYEDDAIELFIGLYDGRGAKHASFLRGATPDYQFAIHTGGVDHAKGGGMVLTPDSADFAFEPLGAADYIIEFRLPWSAFAVESDVPFVPTNGTRIPLDIIIHDSDAANVRDGSLSFSEDNADNSWQSPANWGYTWVGDTTYQVLAIEEPPSPIAMTYKLRQNYPNPFNPVTNIEYLIAKTGQVKVNVYNLLGQQVATLVDEYQSMGAHTAVWNASRMPSGIYFYRLETPEFSKTRKMVLLK